MYLKKGCLRNYLPFTYPWAVVYYSIEAAEILLHRGDESSWDQKTPVFRWDEFSVGPVFL